MDHPTPPAATLWGIDLGGTKVEGAILAAETGWQATHRLRLPTESARGYDHVVRQITRVVEQLEAASGRRRPAIIGIGTPGVTEPATGVLKNSNSVCLNGRPLREDLAAILGCRIEMANDANCFALAEATIGAAAGRGVVIGLILGTGVGSGVVVNGRVLNGRHGIAGEWGHNPIGGEDAPCYCGRRGCVETVISGPALERFYRMRSGQELKLPDIVARRDTGDPAAVATIERLLAKFGEAIAAVINIVDPDAIVIGGGVGNIDALYTDAARQEVLKHLFNSDLKTEFLRPKLGDSAGVFGAAMLAKPDRT
ncbi:MAG TPA: ROK family protein [Opitutaceae bacterium]|nr:ROK family protein [Opitutaceae bacterium]